MIPNKARLTTLCQWGMVSLVLVLGPWLHPAAYGEAVGSPASLLKKGQWLFGLRGGGVWHRAMTGGAEASVVNGAHFRGYGLTDRLSVYAAFGAGYISIKNPSTSRDVSSSFGGNIVVGAQLKALLWESARKTWSWDSSLQYLYVGKPHRRRNNQAFWNDWQVATSLAKACGDVKPYAGLKVSLLSIDYKLRHGENTLGHGTYKPKDLVGPFVGVDWTIGQERNTVLNLEASYLNGAEITFAIAKRF